LAASAGHSHSVPAWVGSTPSPWKGQGGSASQSTQSDLKQNALMARLAGPESASEQWTAGCAAASRSGPLASPASAPAWPALPLSPQSPASDAATWGESSSARRSTPADSCASPGLLRARTQTPSWKQSCADSNDVGATLSGMQQPTPGSAASVTSRLARTHISGQDDSRLPDEHHGRSVGALQLPEVLQECMSIPCKAGLCATSDADAAECSCAAVSAAAGGGEAEDKRSRPPCLSEKAHRAARMHATLINHSPHVHLEADLELLLHLLAVPEDVKVESRHGKDPLFPSGTAAAAYACCVLQSAGRFGLVAPRCSGHACPGPIHLGQALAHTECAFC
jgi:hypothetical protein